MHFLRKFGLEAVDTALKVALHYHKVRGQGQRVRFVGRERGYHGVKFGGTSLGGMVRNKESFGPGLAGVHHMRHTSDFLRAGRLDTPIENVLGFQESFAKRPVQ